jgi:hypothetical protein
MSIFKRVGILVGEPVGSYGRPNQGILEKCRALGLELATAAMSR